MQNNGWQITTKTTTFIYYEGLETIRAEEVILMDELKIKIETEEYIYEEWIIHHNLYKGDNKEKNTGE